MEVLAALSLNGLLSNAIGILGAVLGLGLVIFLHELGHFAVAKWCNVYVERFSIGFGPILLGWKWGETEYALSAIPFGGYVKMLGQDDADPSQMTSEEIAADPRSYISKNVWQRMAIISAGVTMNVITAILFYAGAYGLGVESLAPVIGEVRPGMPAWEAGIRRGDEISHFNGREVSNFRELALNIAVSNGDIELRGIHKDGSPFTTVITPDRSKTRPQIGILPSADLKIALESHGAKFVAQPGSPEAAATPPFEFGDRIVKVNGVETPTYAIFQDQLAARGTEPAVYTVERRGEDQQVKTLDITVPPSLFRTLGMRLDVGQIDSIQDRSPAKLAGLQVGDKLAKINGEGIGTDIDPLQVPDILARLHGESVEIVFLRQNPTGGREEKTVTLVPENRPGWMEQPIEPGEALAVPSIGVAMHIVPFVLHVDPEGPAAQAGVQPNSAVQKFELLAPASSDADSAAEANITISLGDDKNPSAGNNWAYAFWKMQRSPDRVVQLTLREKDQSQVKVVKITPVIDETWSLPVSNLTLLGLTHEERADSIGAAFTMALGQSRNTILNIYQTLRSLVTRNLSYKELHGPLGIAQAAFYSAKGGMVPLLQFLGFLSLNLAVLNFLPIPVLDGGHMVFLLWEAVTRRRPTEQVMIGATYAGMIFLLSLMGLVIYLDVFVHGLWGR